LGAYPRLWDLIAHVQDSEEAERQRINAACGAISARQDARGVDTIASPEELSMLTDHIREVWSRYGRDEAYFSVLTNPAYLRERLGVADIEAFYATGIEEAERLKAVCQRNLIEPDKTWSILELGCGVGRVGEAFAGQFSAYSGVDISAEHLAIARRRFVDKGLTNARLVLLEDFLSGLESFDLFFSMIVLQHNPPPIMDKLLDACLGKIRPGGLAYFQIPCHLYDYTFSVKGYLGGEGLSEDMEIHALSQREVFALLSRHGLTPIEVTPDDRIGPIGFSYTFLAQKGV
jgi:SAM-dependent methyltransferase